MDVIIRGQAKAAGLKRYYTGVKCKHGHLSERFTSSGTCVTCVYTIYKRKPGRQYRSTEKSKKYKQETFIQLAKELLPADEANKVISMVTENLNSGELHGN